MPITAIQPRRLYQQVADQLRALIEDGEFVIGDRLPSERDLAEQLGISRPTVREALIALEVEGRIRIRVGSGIFVAPPRKSRPRAPDAIEGPFELLRARAFIEGALVQEAAALATTADIALLDALLAQMEGGIHASEETIALDRDFHCAIVGILGNAVLVRFVGELFDQRINPYFERLSSYFENNHTWGEAQDEHRAVRDAIAAKDGEAAKAAMRHHLQQSQRRFSLNFGEGRGVEEPAA
jgi:DNA-binding FadR family transcriptional regulator